MHPLYFDLFQYIQLALGHIFKHILKSRLRQKFLLLIAIGLLPSVSGTHW